MVAKLKHGELHVDYDTTVVWKSLSRRLDKPTEVGDAMMVTRIALYGSSPASRRR
jgi:hypothetical protein